MVGRGLKDIINFYFFLKEWAEGGISHYEVSPYFETLLEVLQGIVKVDLRYLFSLCYLCFTCFISTFYIY